MHTFHDFFTHFETQTGFNLCILHADAGREWLNYIVERQLKDRGMILTVTAPDTPAQNGAAERAGAVLTEAARCTMIKAQIPQELEYMQPRRQLLSSTCCQPPRMTATKALASLSTNSWEGRTASHTLSTSGRRVALRTCTKREF